MCVLYHISPFLNQEERLNPALSLGPCDLKDQMPLSVLRAQKAQASDRPGHTLHSLWGQVPSCATHLLLFGPRGL